MSIALFQRCRSWSYAGCSGGSNFCLRAKQCDIQIHDEFGERNGRASWLDGSRNWKFENPALEEMLLKLGAKPSTHQERWRYGRPNLLEMEIGLTCSYISFPCWKHAWMCLTHQTNILHEKEQHIRVMNH